MAQPEGGCPYKEKLVMILVAVAVSCSKRVAKPMKKALDIAF